MLRSSALFLAIVTTAMSVHAESSRFDPPPFVAPLAPPLAWRDHMSTPGEPPLALPVPDTPFIEHVRRTVPDGEAAKVVIPRTAGQPDGLPESATTPVIEQGGLAWVGTSVGLHVSEHTDGPYVRHVHYGNERGPLSSHVTGMCLDSRKTLWMATVAGLSARDDTGHWTSYRGRDGLPIEELTCIVIDAEDQLWIGSREGLIHFRPYHEGRQWFYRQGQRYLPDDHVEALAIAEGGTVLVRTKAGWSAIETVERTLHEKATYLLDRYLERHRRLGMPSPAYYTAPDATDAWTHGPQASDGLWTSYHVTSMTLAYSITGEERYRDLAREGMEALYRLQNVTGIRGLVARCVVAVDESTAPKLREQDNWHETKDGKYLWRDDVSSDQITGHFFAFYTYYEHIAKHDPAERARLEKQLRQVLDYILDNNYQIIDWDGTRTRWGWWNPEMVNEAPSHYLESGLYSLMMPAFLKTAHHITGDKKYMDHYESLIVEHDYLSNMLLQKKVFPDELNHSDDQLSALVFYIFLETEEDPVVRNVLHRALRRHACIEAPERNSLLAMVYAATDPEDADIEGALRTLREMPLDRRDWRQENSHRDDVMLQRVRNVGGQVLTADVLPADERSFERWNADPYVADVGGDGLVEGAGVHWMLPYWLARYHGILEGP
ncbi:MAG: hypothetical protein GY851_26245 [bacterium]|nr:hypothetical protein [bacterium]